MSDSNDSGLFGTDDELYTDDGHHGDHEPYAQTLAAAGEPLFPAAPDPSWTEQISARPRYEQSDFDQGYALQPEISDTYSEQFYGSHQIEAAEPMAGESSNLYTSPATENIDEPVEVLFTAAEDAPAEPFAATASAWNIEQPPQEPEVVSRESARSEKETIFNRHFAVLMDLMQHGAWPQALEKLQAMRAQYPGVAALDNLLDEAALKAELMAEWTYKIKGRRLTVAQEWLIRRSLPFLVLLLLFVGGVVFYRIYIAPSRQVVAMERANQALVEEATALLQTGQIDEAIQLYNQILSSNPDNAAARQGLVDASRLSGLAVTYDLAIRVANSGNLKRSLLMLQTIKAKSPSFRDIDARLQRVNKLLEAEAAYAKAEKSIAQRRWVDAITYYEQTQLAAPDYQAARVLIQLDIAYSMAIQRLMTQWPTPEFGTEQIRNFLRRAQETRGQDESIRFFLVDLDDFIKGERAFNNENLDQAVEVWRGLYEDQPAFLGGYLAEQLYRAYLLLAAEARADDADYARELYTLAASMPVHDSSEARLQLQSLGAAVPPPQPTPTPQPILAYVAPVVAAPVAPVDTPTPEPTATPANAYSGWILFRSTRTGWEDIYIMRGNGSEQQLAPEELRGRIDAIYHEEQRGLDGRLAFVQSAPGRSDANLYIAGSDGLNNNMITDHLGDEYDPVWSPAGDRIAFVANHTGNDEIWTMRADGAEQRQLTSNEWEWDKHPTWSPDGRQIAFFSNRSGQRQIWVMESDGAYPQNLSSNIYDDWDPVWLK
jgi:TolB protein